MIIYNKAGLANLHVLEQAEAAQDAGLISETELKNIREKYPTGFYMPTLVVRIGFFILTLVGSIFFGALLSLLFEQTHIINHPVWPMFLGLVTYAALEFFVKENRLFKAGTDDALLWISAALLTGSFIWAVGDKSNGSMFISAFILLLSLYFTLRFANVLMGMIAALSALALVFFVCGKAGAIGEATMPFVMMLCSYFIFYTVKKAQKDAGNVNYHDCLVFIKLAALLTLYAAGNYFVVQRLSNQLHHLPAENNDPLPFSWFFWLWTMLLPFAYIASGIKTKSLMLLRIGLLLVVAAGSTFRNYYHILPVEYALVIAGTVLLLLAIFLIRYLQTPRNGFAYAQRNSRHWANNIHLEALIVAGAAHTSVVPEHTNDRFGGGNFGGGGSSGDF